MSLYILHPCHFCNFLRLLRTRCDVCKLIAKKALRGNDPMGSNSSRGAIDKSIANAILSCCSFQYTWLVIATSFEKNSRFLAMTTVVVRPFRVYQKQINNELRKKSW
jgi:hypothetical protein